MIFFYNQVSFSEETLSCNTYTEKYNRKYNLPNKLVTSISLVETGVKMGKKMGSWPWALNINGKSMYFADKNKTKKYLKETLKKNKKVDIGCMQINYRYHGHMFENLDQILSPEYNVNYAAKFLKTLFKRHKSWNEAISRYHSSEPKRKKKYLIKVKNFWDSLRQKKIIIAQPRSNQSNKKRIEFFKEILKKEKNKI